MPVGSQAIHAGCIDKERPLPQGRQRLPGQRGGCAQGGGDMRGVVGIQGVIDAFAAAYTGGGIGRTHGGVSYVAAS